MYRNPSILIFFFLLAVCSSSNAQELDRLGVPLIVNYDTKSLGFNNQTWAINQDEDGILYFANGQLILSYDGVDWNTIHDSPGMVNRAIHVTKGDSLFLGMDGNYGYLKKKGHSYKYNSLHLFNKDVKADIEEFWNVHLAQGNTIFQTFRNLYVHQGRLTTKIPAPHRFRWSYKVEDDLYVNDIKYGVFKLAGTNLEPIVNAGNLNPGIIGVTKLQGKLLILTETEGLYWYENKSLIKFEFPSSSAIERSKIFSYLKLKNGNLAIGTVTDGLFILDEKGEVVEHINKRKGLQNNTVLDIYQDREMNLWLGLDYGIDFVKLNSKLTYKIDYLGDFGTAYSAIKENGKLYIGTNQGLYDLPLNRTGNIADDHHSKFKPLIKGQVWNVSKIDGEIFVGHDQGAFLLKEGKLEQLGAEPGAWNFRKLKSPSNIMLCGNYSGVSIYRKEDGRWKFVNKIQGYEESGKFLEVDSSGYLWLALRSKGLFRLMIDYDTGNIKSSEFFPKEDLTDQWVCVATIDEEIVLSTRGKAFVFNEAEKAFVESPKVFTAPYSDRTLKFGNLQWGLSNQHIGVFDQKDSTATKFSEINDRLIFELLEVSKLDENYYMIPIYNGFAIYSHHKKTTSIDLKNEKPIVKSIRAIDSKNNYDTGAQIPYSDNNLTFSYAYPAFSEGILYQTKLDTEEQWSSWTNNTNRSYLNLREGSYVFKVRHKHGNNTGENQISFTVRPPIYRTYIAYFLYVLAFVSTIFGFIYWNHYRIRKERKKLLERKRTSLNEQANKYKEQELIQKQRIIELENKNLQEEIRGKSRELAKVAHVNLNKNKVLKKIKEKVISVQEKSKNKLPDNYHNEIIRLIDYYITDKESKIFELNFDKSHQVFYEKLSKKYPELTAKDLRLCAYLKMNLSTKEIAPLLGISPQSVDVSRHRLRKKMGLSSRDNLTNILIAIE